jgi:predicted Zn-dependent protease with MMP-like domain
MGARCPLAAGRDCRQGPIQHRASVSADKIGVPNRITDNGPVIEMSREQFEELVSEALDSIPPELARLVDNCVVLVEEEAPNHDQHLLGLYVGTPLTERGRGYTMVTPDRITIFRGPILAICDTANDVVEEVHITVVHEIAHHFGIGDRRLHDLGYG